MKEVMKICKIQHCFTTSYHPQTNGLTERLYRTLINMISMYVNTDQENWDEILPFINHAYNTTIQEATGYSLYFLLFGREPMTRQVVVNNKEKTQERIKRNYYKKHNEIIYELGLFLAVWTPKLSNVNILIEPKDNPDQDPSIVHVSRLKPYFERIDEVTHENAFNYRIDKFFTIYGGSHNSGIF
ncbi:K02A2.6-like [Cordylochernes scorpioides]|uniref:K02A2.6-like n=1 Tax=Cordylochernes scorpioides TaxID=51811 RepID=A0ABY6KDQ3_9ARAC|nr:K02A2.6-like [Cordylochernes scorpioides]